MAHVITEQCIKCKFTDCVAVCPVAAFREAEEYLIIDPVECIDCTLCGELQLDWSMAPPAGG